MFRRYVVVHDSTIKVTEILSLEMIFSLIINDSYIVIVYICLIDRMVMEVWALHGTCLRREFIALKRHISDHEEEEARVPKCGYMKLYKLLQII